MKLSKYAYMLGLALAASATGFSTSALADSAAVTTGNAAARLDFQITIPRTLSFRVGSAAAGTIDMISFAPTVAQLGNGVSVAGTGGDLTAGAVTARVSGNSGQITITPATVGALIGTGTNTIPWTQITTTSTVLTSATALAAPLLVNGNGTAVNAPAPVNGVTTADARWTFGYANTAVPAAGVYGGTVAKNGRVTYTAAMP